jgi:hypothetical protein
VFKNWVVIFERNHQKPQSAPQKPQSAPQKRLSVETPTFRPKSVSCLALMNRIHQVPGLHCVEAQVVAGPKGASRPSSFLGSGSKSKYYGDLRSSIGSVGGKIEKDLPELRSDTASEYSKETTSERTATMDSNIEIHQPTTMTMKKTKKMIMMILWKVATAAPNYTS